VAVASRLASVPRLIHTDHGRQSPDPFLDRAFDHLASRLTAMAVAVSEPLARQLRATVVARRCPITTIPNGIDTDRFAPGPRSLELSDALGLAGRPIIGSLGRFDPIKGYDILLRAFAQVRAGWMDGPSPALVLAGEGPEADNLRGLAHELGIEADVRFLGWRADPEILYRWFDVFVLGSRSEGTSLSLLESMSCGTVPVVTDVGGNRDVLGPELADSLVPSEQPVALGERLRQALANPSRRRAEGQLARRRVRSEFSLDRMVQAYTDLYLDLRPR